MSDDPSVYYFAYGSNMDPQRFRSRVGDWMSLSRATLDGYSLRFAHSVRSEGGGGAVVDPVVGGRVDGVLFEISAEQLRAMDREEFDASRDRRRTGRRVRVAVRTAEGERSAELYTVDDDGRFHPPSERYLGHILAGLEAAGYGSAARERVRGAAEEARRRRDRRD
jgi:cation transport regulator ChaC